MPSTPPDGGLGARVCIAIPSTRRRPRLRDPSGPCDPRPSGRGARAPARRGGEDSQTTQSRGVWSAYLKFWGEPLRFDNALEPKEPSQTNERSFLSTPGDLGIDNLDTVTRPVRGPEPRGDFPAGPPNGLEERVPEGEVRRGRGRERAARAVERLSVSSASEADHPDAVEEHIDEGALEMASLDQHRAQLFPNFRGGDREDRIDRPRVLGRHASNDARPVHADRRERLQVRLNSRAAPGVAACDRQGGAHLRGKQDAAFKSDARHVVSVVSGTPLNSARLIGTEVRARSGHIKFDKKVRWKNLVSAFRPLFLKFLEETQQLPEDMESVDVLVEENLRDLRSNRKPEGYNREGVMRMIFPISNEVQFYVYGRGKALEVARVTEALSRVLQKYRLKHTIEWGQLKLLADKKE